MKKFLNKNWQIVLILILALILRLYKLGEVPVELNRDEASLGYTAYSILKTGHEEHGVYWPIQIESFGDWKLPLYVYSLIPLMAVFGMEAWVIRLPSALAGVAIVWLSYLLVPKLIKSSNKSGDSEKITHLVRLILPALLAVSPWNMHMSHVAYEAHLSLAFFLGGYLFLEKALENKKSRFLNLTLAHSFLAITMIGYHSFQAFVPLFWLAYVWWNKTKLLNWLGDFKTNKRAWLGFGKTLLPFILVGVVLLGSGVTSANSTKFSGLSIFDLDSYTNQTRNFRLMFKSDSNPGLNSLPSLFYANKLSGFFRQIETNIFALFSPAFFYVMGGNNGAHNIAGIGNLYGFTVVGLLMGLYYLIKGGERWQKWLLIWVGLTTVAPMITFVSNSTTRFTPGFVPLEMIASYGLAILLVSSLKKKKLQDRFILIMIGLWAIFSILSQMVRYYYISGIENAKNWPWEMKSLVNYLELEKNNYDKIFYQDEQSSPYIYFLYHLKVDPSSLSERVEYYPPDAEGFRHVKRFDNIYFQKIDWNATEYLYENVLYVIGEREIPDYNRYHERIKLMEKFEHKWVEKGIELWRYKKI